MFVKDLGFSPIEAIKAGTSEAARGLQMYGETGAVKEGYLADVIVVKGDVSDNVSLLGDPQNINRVILNGEVVELPPVVPRQDPPGWRVSHYGSQILHWQDVQDG